MFWIIFTFISITLFAIVNISDKFVIDKFIKEPLVPVLIGSVIGLIVSLYVLISHGYSDLNSIYIFLAILSGASYMLMGYFYFKAVLIEEISRIVPLFYISNILIAIFAAIFLGEILSPSKYLAIAMIIVGVILISIKNFEKPKLDKGTLFMIIAATLAATNMLLNKFVLNHSDFWTVYGWNRLGGFLLLLPIIFLNRKNVLAALKSCRKSALGLVAVNETLNLTALVFLIMATSLGLVTVVTGIAAVQPLLVFVFTLILSFFWPTIIREELSKQVVARKLIAVTIIIIGATLLL